MKRFLIKIAGFVFILIVVSFPLEWLLNKVSGTHSKQDWILSREGEVYDYGFIGSSRVLNVIDISSMKKALSGRLINLGTSGSNYAESYVLLKEFLEKNELHNLVINVDEFSLNSSLAFSHSFHDYNMLQLFKEYEAVFCDYLPEWKCNLWSMLPLSRYIEYNTRINLLSIPHNTLNQTMGYEAVGDEEAPFEKGTQYLTVDKKDLMYLFKIIRLCRENKVRVQFITTPVYKDIVKVKLNRDEAYNLIKAISLKNDIPYIPGGNFIDETDPEHFRDYTHLTAKSSAIYSEKLGHFLFMNDPARH